MSTYDTNIPNAAGYEQANLLARRAYDNAMARHAQRRSQSLLHYGYAKDASGNIGVDPNNEYGAYQQMMKGEDAQSHGLGRAQRASGWGADSGYFGQQREALQHQQGGEQADLGTKFTDELAGISQDEQDAAFGRDQALYQNEHEAAQNAIAQGNYNPANYEGIDVPYGQEQPPPPAGKKAQGHGHLRDQPNIHQRNKQRLLERAVRGRRGRRR